MKVRLMLQPKRLKQTILGALIATTAISVALIPILEAQSAAGRWLQIQRISGDVTTLAGPRKSAQVGDRLSAAGHGLITSNRSSAHLAVDDGIGTIAVAQNTRLAIRQLSVLSDGSKITVIDVPQGQARLQVRRFTHPNSRLELHTPSGVAAVRGTEFGVSVDDEGQTNVATLEGQVEAIAQDVAVPVDAGMVSIIHPGEPPTSTRSLDRKLDIQWDLYEWRDDHFYMAGRIDAANTLLAMGEELSVSRTGHFEQKLRLSDRSLPVVLTVQNAVGESRTHRLLPWLSND
ncbi:MAG: FecR family protein [Cyanobacteria bacterium P01_H01_bin.21]